LDDVPGKPDHCLSRFKQKGSIMQQTFMSQAYQGTGPFVWPLAPRKAVTLTADGAPRALWVHEGRVWLTRQCPTGMPDDIWLDAGQSHTLPAGTEWVVEAWPQARVSLVQAAPAVVKRRAAPFWARPWRGGLLHA
jgi:hypothetical protein